MARLLAVDWGSSARRAFLIEDGALTHVERDGRGVLTGSLDMPAELTRLTERYAPDRILLAGMIGSNRGWIDAGYVAAPATLATLAAAAKRPLPRIAIVPGVACRGTRPDVMRGEEVALLGAVAGGLAPGDALLCQPGTHCKWAHMEQGAIAGFVTAMTGELFALLREQSLIGAEMTRPPVDDTGFAQGLAASADQDLLAHLFSVRSASLLGARPPGTAASFVSGLLIGADVRARISAGQDVYLLAHGALAPLYRRAIQGVGGRAYAVDAEEAFVAGAVALEELIAWA